MRTAESIIKYFTDVVSEQKPITPNEWLEGASYLNVLIGAEQNKLAVAEQEYTKVALAFIEIGDTNAVAEKKAKASPEFIKFKNQQAFIKQIEEFIRLAKKQASLAQEQGA